VSRIVESGKNIFDGNKEIAVKIADMEIKGYIRICEQVKL